jgi:uncharacterized protein YndB with AHSA1/START domain
MADLETIVVERTINAPPARVWRALTDPAELKEWLPFMANFKLLVGNELRFKLGKDRDHQYLHVSKLIEFTREEKLVYGWRYDGHDGNAEITYELAPMGHGSTKLRLTCQITEPFPADNPDFATSNFEEGWTYTAAALKKFAESN